MGVIIPARDDIIRIHREVMAAACQDSREYDGLDIRRLDHRLELARFLISDSSDPIDAAVAICGELARSEAFLSGTCRTALATAATMLALEGMTLPRDWSGFAELVDAASRYSLSPTRAREAMTSWLRQHLERDAH